MGQENLENKRHSLAHLLASAVLNLYPDTKMTLGPAIENGFYYDFEFSTPISEKDLPKIEKEMKKILPHWQTFEKFEVSADEARKIFQGNEYKLELIDEIEKNNEQITLYYSGEKKQLPKIKDLLNPYTLYPNFLDLCRGGHIENPSKDIGPDTFKLDRIAGAYWRGNEKNQMLTRIYGLAFNSKKELDEFIKQREEAVKRDHRKIGKELNLFTFSDLIGAGLPLFTPKGRAMRDAIENKISSIQEKFGFQKVWIPHITKPDLYKTSGHWEKFGDELFKVKSRESDFVMKPMNCPHHTQIYASQQRSYKDLPVRFVETTTVYRDEQSGELLGLSRVRSITQDDGHIFCAPEQIPTEIKNVIEVIKEFYSSLGMWKDGNYRVILSTRDPKDPERYLGDDKIWQESETNLKNIADNENLPYSIEKGEAAFYGPKLDFKFKDAIGREWQLATIQLDFNMPERFGLEYTDKDGSKKTPVMIHRAISGSLERFLSVIIEHFAGAFPLWLSPVQLKILPVSEKHFEYARAIGQELKQNNLRIEIDESNENLGKKVRQAKLEKVPYFLVLGDKETTEKNITLESRDEGNLGVFNIASLVEFLKKENA